MPKKKTNRTSGNEKINNVIKEAQEAQLRRIDSADIGHLSEWIPHNQFSNIREIIGKNPICLLAEWENGPLHYHYNMWERKPNKKVHLKCLYHDSQNITNEFPNEVGNVIHCAI